MEPGERFERIERQLEFLAASQAQHDARMAEISRKQDESSAQIGQLVDLTLKIGRVVQEQAYRIGDLTESQLRTDQRLSAQISALTESQLRTDQRLSAQISALTESQLHTDQRLTTLIGVVERYFSGSP